MTLASQLETALSIKGVQAANGKSTEANALERPDQSKFATKALNAKVVQSGTPQPQKLSKLQAKIRAGPSKTTVSKATVNRAAAEQSVATEAEVDKLPQSSLFPEATAVSTPQSANSMLARPSAFAATMTPSVRVEHDVLLARVLSGRPTTAFDVPPEYTSRPVKATKARS